MLNSSKAVLNIIRVLAPLAGSFILILLPVIISKMLTDSLNQSLGALLMALVIGGFILPLAVMLLTLSRMEGSPAKAPAAVSIVAGCIIDIVALALFVGWMKMNNLGL